MIEDDFLIDSIWLGKTLLWPVIRKLITQATAAYGAIFGPNNSTAIILAAIGVLAAPARRLTNPIDETVAKSILKILANNVPAVAPIKKIGVTIPPLPPKLRVMPVKIIFIMNAYDIITFECLFNSFKT